MAWPPPGFSLRWFGEALDNPTIPRPSCTSILAALGAVAIALVLGTLAAMAVQRYSFFGRESISFLLVLPIALPGVRDRHRPEHDVPDGRRQLRADDDHRRARHVLRRHRLQQRHRPPAPPAADAGGGLRRPRGGHLDHVPPDHDAGRCGPRCCPAACWPSPSRSTRSSSPCSRPGRARRRSRCGSSPPCSGRPSCRSSTSSRSCSSCSPSSRSTSRSGSAATPRAAVRY